VGDAAFRFGYRWLFASMLGMVGLGALLIVADTRWLPWYPAAMTEAFWGAAELPPEVVRYHRFVHAVLGATILSWAVALLFVLRGPFRERRRWAYGCVAVSLLSWFVPDTAASLFHGAWPNAVFNLTALVALGAPLVFLRRAFAIDRPDLDVGTDA